MLDLSCNPLADGSSETVAKLLNLMPALEKLGLRSVGAKKTFFVGPIQQSWTSSRNHQTAHGQTLFSSDLSQLRDVDVGDNLLTNEGIQHLLAALPFSQITDLNLSLKTRVWSDSRVAEHLVVYSEKVRLLRVPSES